MGSSCWSKAVSVVASRLASIVYRRFSVFDQCGLAFTAEDVSQLMVMESAESIALRSVLCRSPVKSVRESVTPYHPHLNLLKEGDLSSLHHIKGLDRTTRALLAQEALRRGLTNEARVYLPEITEKEDALPSSALASFLFCQSLWVIDQGEAEEEPTTHLGWEWERYRYIDINGLSSSSPADDEAQRSHHDDQIIISAEFWSQLTRSISLSRRSRSWQQLQNGLRLIHNVIVTVNRPPERMRSLHPLLTVIVGDALDMIDEIKSASSSSSQSMAEPPIGNVTLGASSIPSMIDDGVSRRRPIDLSFGLRYSLGHDLVLQDEWRSSLWFMAIVELDLDLVYFVVQWTVWILYQAQQWETIVTILARFDELTQAHWMWSHIHFLVFAQQQLLKVAQDEVDRDRSALETMQKEMEKQRLLSAQRRTMKRSRLGKEEEDAKLAAILDSFEPHHQSLLDRRSTSQDTLDVAVHKLKGFMTMTTDVERDRNICFAKLDRARHTFWRAMSHGQKAVMDDAIDALEDVVQVATKRQELTILARALLDQGDIHLLKGRPGAAARAWYMVLETLSLQNPIEFRDRDSLLKRIGFWNLVYGIVACERLSVDADLTKRLDLAKMSSVLSWSMLGMSSRHPSSLIDLTATPTDPDPVFPGQQLFFVPDRVRLADYLSGMSWGARELMTAGMGLYALPLITALRDGERRSRREQLQGQALPIKVQVCLALGQIGEALSLLSRHLGHGGSRAGPSVIWRDDQPLEANDACIKTLCGAALPEHEDVRLSWCRVMAYFVSLGRYECFDAARLAVEQRLPIGGFPYVLLRCQLYWSRGLFPDCIIACNEALALQPSPAQWFQLVAIKLEAAFASGQLETVDEITGAIDTQGVRFGEERLRRRARLLHAEVDALRGDVDRSVEKFASELPDDNAEHEYFDSADAFASILIRRDQCGDCDVAIRWLSSTLYMVEKEAEALGGMHLPPNRYLPLLRTLATLNLTLSDAYHRQGEQASSSARSTDALRYFTMLPYPDPALEAKVRCRQLRASAEPSPELAISSVNAIIGSGHDPRSLVRALIALSRQLPEQDLSSRYCLVLAAKVTNGARRLQSDLSEIGAATTPVDKLDAGLLRDVRDASASFILDARTALSSSPVASLDAIKTDLPKTTTLDLIQFLIALRQEAEGSWRHNALRQRYIQLLHTFLADHVAGYRSACCMQKIDTISQLSAEAIPTSIICLGWDPIDLDSQLQVQYIVGDKSGRVVADRTTIGRIYETAGACCISASNQEIDAKSVAETLATLSTLIQLAFGLLPVQDDDVGNSAEDLFGSVPNMLETVSQLQRLFDVHGVQMVDDESLVEAMGPVLGRAPTSGPVPK